LARKWLLRRIAADLSHKIKATRGRMDTPFRRALGHFETVFIDHSVFRAIYPNRHRVGAGLWRAAQPSPAQIAWAARHGIRTIINLRGRRECASYILEEEACRRHGITLVDFPVNSRQAPTRETLHAVADLFRRVEYPALLHCKSGADRAGLISALYLLVHDGRPLAEAQAQLSWRYGHFRQARTGVLDHLFDLYAIASAKAPIGFMEWLDCGYDPAETDRSFRSRKWADTLVDGMLERE
jgi:protein tyrosine/serine phosphatase